MHVNESKLPPEIEDYIRDSNLHFQSEQEEPKVDHTSTKDFIGVTGIPKSIFD